MIKKLRQQTGGILIITAFSLVPLFGLAMLASELGIAYVLRTQMQNAADVAALSSIKLFARMAGNPDLDQIRNIAFRTAQNNTLSGRGPVFLDAAPGGDIDFGTYDFDAETFTSVSDDQVGQAGQIVNAIRVTTRMEEGANLPMVFLLGRVVETLTGEHHPAFRMEAQSVATFGMLNIAIAFDISASMDNETYQPTSDCADVMLDTNADRRFNNVATDEEYPDCLGPVNADHNVVTPEPITGVAEVIRDTLLENPLFATFYRAGLVFFETEAYTPVNDVRLRFDNPNNREDLQNYLTHIIDTWVAYAATDPLDYYLNNTKQTSPEFAALLQREGSQFPFPGGTNQPSTGWTNTGEAIAEAVSQIVAVNAVSGTQGTDLIILFTDGEPTCIDAGQTARNPPCGSDLTAAARQWSHINAVAAANENITIQAIYFSTNPGENCDNPLDPPAAFIHLRDEVAGVTEDGRAFCAQDIDCSGPNCLRTIFEELSQEPRFVLAPNLQIVSGSESEG